MEMFYEDDYDEDDYDEDEDIEGIIWITSCEYAEVLAELENLKIKKGTLSDDEEEAYDDVLDYMKRHWNFEHQKESELLALSEEEIKKSGWRNTLFS